MVSTISRRAEVHYGSILSPISKLPTELLTDIFFRCCDDNELTRWINHPSLPPALVLGTICAYWREIMLSTPELWSCITISDYYPPQTVPTRKKLLQLYLERSRQWPLTLTLEDGPQAPIENSAIELLVRDSHRWRDVTMNFWNKRIDALASLENRMPLVEKLALTIPSIPMYAIFCQMPALHTLSLSADGPESYLALPWEQILHLTRSFCCSSAIIAILERCPNVLTLELDQCIEDNAELGQIGILDLPVVSSLHTFNIKMETYRCDIAPTLFDAVTFPFLTTMSVSLDMKEGWSSSRSVHWSEDVFAISVPFHPRDY